MKDAHSAAAAYIAGDGKGRFRIGGNVMVMTTFSGYLVIQGGGTTAKPAAPVTQQGPATTGRDAQRIDTRELRDQIREQVRAAVAASAQGAEGIPARVPPPELRQFTIQGPNGERTVIGVPPAGEIIPPQAVDISIAFFLMVAAIIIGLPLARAFARRMDRKGGGPAQIP